MPVFEIEKNGMTFEVEAPDENAAFSAFNAQPGPEIRGDPTGPSKQGPTEQLIGSTQAAATNFGDTLLMGLGPKIAGVSQYTKELGAPGSFGRGEQEYNEQQRLALKSDPPAYHYGGLIPYALPIGGIGGAAVAGLTRLGAKVPGSLGLIARALGVPGAHVLEHAATIATKAAAPKVASAAGRASGISDVQLGKIIDALSKNKAASRMTSTGGRGVSPHERINSIADALRAQGRKAMSEQDYIKRAKTYERRYKSYEHRANVGQAYPETY